MKPSNTTAAGEITALLDDLSPGSLQVILDVIGALRAGLVNEEEIAAAIQAGHAGQTGKFLAADRQLVQCRRVARTEENIQT